MSSANGKIAVYHDVQIDIETKSHFPNETLIQTYYVSYASGDFSNTRFKIWIRRSIRITPEMRAVIASSHCRGLLSPRRVQPNHRLLLTPSTVQSKFQ
jgi:hypothetical protein